MTDLRNHIIDIDIDTQQEKTVEELSNNSDTIAMYAFYDTKAGRYDTPFFCQNDLFAGRHYKMVVEKEGTMINKFKREFDVHRIGFYHLLQGAFTETPEVIIEGKKVYKEEE